jgi:formylglycine-generating enzyme required for sulfatase activity
MQSEKFIVPPLCEVPAGPFLIGSDPEFDAHARKDEVPQHTVVLPAFEIAQFPVTVAEYACAVKAHVVPAPFRWEQQLPQPTRPAVNMAWRHALAYAERLAALLDEPWHLSTEAQWEKAARGTNGRLYPWGDTWTSEQTSSFYSAIGQHPAGASPYGVQDLVVNIWQWVTSYRRPYPYDPSDGREDLTSPEDFADLKRYSDGTWTVRGARGGFNPMSPDRAAWQRVAVRGGHYPSINVEDAYGFRLLRQPTGTLAYPRDTQTKQEVKAQAER